MCASVRPDRLVRDTYVGGMWAEVEIVGWSVYGTPAMLGRARDERRKEEELGSGEGSAYVG